VERLDVRREQVQARNAEIAAELASVAAAGRIEAAARGRLGLVEAAETTYVEADRRRR
jgi:cell division protein FtsB